MSIAISCSGCGDVPTRPHVVVSDASGVVSTTCNRRALLCEGERSSDRRTSAGSATQQRARAPKVGVLQRLEQSVSLCVEQADLHSVLAISVFLHGMVAAMMLHRRLEEARWA